MSSGYRVAVVGATGNVGREILNILAERQFPLAEVAAVASPRSTGDIIDFGENGQELKVKNLEHFDFTGWDIALFAAGSDVSKIHVPRAAQAGCTVIDNSSLYRMDPDVPLIVPEVNPQAIDGYRAKNIIANPNCSTAQLVVALKPLHEAATIRRVVVATYQSVSGTGKAAMDELFNQSRNIFVGDASEPDIYPKQIAFNVIPQAGDFLEDGSTTEEWKLVVETKKILDPAIKVSATCVRVPVFVGHAEAVHLEFRDAAALADLREALAAQPGLELMDEPSRSVYPTPLNTAGDDRAFVGRLRVDPSVEHGVAFWCVTDNLRKGAATNAIQIAEELIRRGKV